MLLSFPQAVVISAWSKCVAECLEMGEMRAFDTSVQHYWDLGILSKGPPRLE